MKKLLLLSGIVLPSFCFAQISVTNAGTPAQIATFLTGNGVVMSNVNVYGQPWQYGYFTAQNSTLAMSGGMVLTTGSFYNVPGPNSSTSAGTSNNISYGDTSLMGISPMCVYDVCKIEMDCVPSDDTLFFNYLFGSEEYDEYVGSSFNDAFGIFVYGTNPAGGSYNDTNMALLPNGIPVAINNVNNGPSNAGPCLNCAYYMHNYTDTTLQYDGTTTNLTAMIPVVPGMTYHIKIIVGDAGDYVYDSGVFLQAGSFRCSGGPLGIAHTTIDNKVTAYPVPANDFVNFQFASIENPEVQFTVRSLDGKLVEQQQVTTQEKRAQLDVSDLDAGTYIVEINHDGMRDSKLITVSGK